MRQLSIYVKPTSNSPGLPLQFFELLSPEWTGERLVLPFGEGDEEKRLEVVGWTDLFFGSPCQVHVAAARWPALGRKGYLVWGGNAGIRILDDEAKPIPGVDDHLPRGYGRPIIWIEDAGDLPPEVRAVIEEATE